MSCRRIRCKFCSFLVLVPESMARRSAVVVLDANVQCDRWEDLEEKPAEGQWVYNERQNN